MSLFNGLIKLHLRYMKIIHCDLMRVQNIPNSTQGEHGLLKPLTQFLKGLGLRGVVHVTMGTHSINLERKINQSTITEDQSNPLT